MPIPCNSNNPLDYSIISISQRFNFNKYVDMPTFTMISKAFYCVEKNNKLVRKGDKPKNFEISRMCSRVKLEYLNK